MGRQFYLGPLKSVLGRPIFHYWCSDFNLLNETLLYFSLSFVHAVAFNLPTFAKGAFDIYRKIVVQVMLKMQDDVRT